MNGAKRITAERGRHLLVEGWTIERDVALYPNGELAKAAACYLIGVPHAPNANWPWDAEWWKPSSRIRDLEKAGALIAAEIDRLLAAAPEEGA